MRGSFLFIALGLALATPALADRNAQADVLKSTIEALCPLDDLTSFDAQLAIPGSWLVSETRLPNPQDPFRITVTLALAFGDELTIERRQFRGRLRQFVVSYSTAEAEGLRPALQAIADGACTIQSGRAMRWEGEAFQYLDQLDGDLTTLRWTETLQAPWPEGQDSGGVRITVVDSGLAYDLPIFANNLARDAAGTPLGYDFWDLDPWPYDGDVSRGAFLPIRHGTAVASLLVREAPDAMLIPFRYPRPDMTRMAQILERTSAAGAKILAMPLGSNAIEDWGAFAEALAAHDILAIVSAGNDGRDIDESPIYPAALAAENILTVTSADAFGQLANGSNWGGESVDIMLPAENLPITDFRGASGVASGSSYAVPRLAALAARVMERDPTLSARALKAAILARAAPSPFERAGVVAGGWIPDPLAD